MQDIEPGFVRVSGIGRHKPTKHKAASAQTDRPNAHLKTILRIDPPGRRSGATSSSSFYPSAQATSKEAANVAFTRFESDGTIILASTPERIDKKAGRRMRKYLLAKPLAAELINSDQKPEELFGDN
jgi:hypothetical protein